MHNLWSKPVRSGSLVGLLIMLLGLLPALLISTPAQAAPTNQISLRVLSARSEPRALDGAGVLADDPIASYQWMINLDNTGDTSATDAACAAGTSAYDPANCPWPSLSGYRSNAPVVAQGTQDDLSELATMSLPSGRYLISVIADGFKIDGAHFSLPAESATGSHQVIVGLQPLPLPSATIRVRIFEDNAPTNGQPDMPAESGLAGFAATVADLGGQVSTDVFGNPICTQYETDGDGAVILDGDGLPTPIPGTGGACISDANGDIVIPNMGPNRHVVAATAPSGTPWVLTTTLEGNKDWDTWLQEGATGYDTEFAVAGEPFPFTLFGFVRAQAIPVGQRGDNTITGRVMKVESYVPYQGGVPFQGETWGGLGGQKVTGVIERPYVALSNLGNGDTMIYTGRGNANGTFSIPNVADGTYLLSWWDEPINHLFEWRQINVSGGGVTDVGELHLTGWFTQITGTVFFDTNRNGRRDAGEQGVSNFPISVRRRDNTIMDRGAVGAFTSSNGSYALDNLYPLATWLIIEAVADTFRTTGVTYQTSSQDTETTILDPGVDINVLPIIGQSARLDWGVERIPFSETGGMAGTVSYDTTRNELDPALAAIEGWQPSIAGMTVNLYQAVWNDELGDYERDPVTGAYLKGQLINAAITETWEQPQGCIPRDADGRPLDPAAIPVLAPLAGGQPGEVHCLEAPLSGVQFGSFNGGTTFQATVDGNFGFADGCFGVGGFDADSGACADGSDPTALPFDDYLVEVVSPLDMQGQPVYQVTREEDINVFGGDQYVPQVPPPPCAGDLHTVDVAGVGADSPEAVVNGPFADGGGSPFEGDPRPLCNVKLVSVGPGRTAPVGFNFFTEVPLPGRLFTYIIDDLNLSTDPTSSFFGEKAGVPNVPIGFYDYTNRLVFTARSDRNGVLDVLLPSTTTINCPSPSGVCPNLYRLVGNDPGAVGSLNPDFNPQFRTISAIFEVYAGMITPADLAPTQVGVSIQSPGSQFAGAVVCALAGDVPQLFSVSRPYAYGGATPNGQRTITIRGAGFLARNAVSRVTLNGTPMQIVSWSTAQIVARVPTTLAAGAYQLEITNRNGRRTVNGITIHVLGAGYSPTLYEVGPGRAYAVIQDAIDAAEASAADDLVVVYPGQAVPFTNPGGFYYENLVLTRPLRLQGTGPGGVTAGGGTVPGAVIDGAAYGGDTATATAWRTRVGDLLNGAGWDGNQNVAEGEVIYILTRDGVFGSGYRAMIDGLSLQGGDQRGFPNNINVIGGGATGLPAAIETQGGAVFANAYARHLQISNNIVQSNGGAFGALRFGTPNLGSNHNEGLTIRNNRIIANAGTNLGGAISLFTGADGYEIAGNDICGNFSAEYGGGISHYGLSPNGSIHHNRIYYNRSYDEGAGVMVAGELPDNPANLSDGSGPVRVYNNLIQANLANDDGGGLRFLMAGNFPIEVFNNAIINNVSTHEGGGIAIDDASNLRIYNNTIAKNLTTATATTSTGDPAPAGLSTGANSVQLQATLPPSAPAFSNPLLFNNLLWDNRAGSWAGIGITGIGLAGDVAPINIWDLGTADGSGLLSPSSSQLSNAGQLAYVNASPTLLTGNPLLAATYDTQVAAFAWRTGPSFINTALLSVTPPAQLQGNYRLTNVSAAIDAGTGSAGGTSAPGDDLDGAARPQLGTFDIGAYEAAGAAPAPAFLDRFNRTNGNLGNNWQGPTPVGSRFLTNGYYRIVSNQAEAYNSSWAVWNSAAGVFAPTQEAAFTFRQLPSTTTLGGLMLKVNNAGGTNPNGLGGSATAIGVSYNAATGRLFIETLDPSRGVGAEWATHWQTSSVSFAAGDTLAVRAYASGWVHIYKNGSYVGGTNVTTGPSAWPSSLASGGGRVGMWFIVGGTPARIDDFRGGSTP